MTDHENYFATDVTSAFHPIMKEYGYRVGCSESFCIQLESANVLIRIGYDSQRSYELDFCFVNVIDGNTREAEEFGLGEIYREFGVPNASSRSFLQTSDYQAVKSFISETAETLREWCPKILAGDRKSFQAVRKRQLLESAEYTKSFQLRAARSKAEKAWKENRYQDYMSQFQNR